MVDILKEEKLIVKLKERLDTTNAQESADTIEPYLKELSSDIVLDVKELDYISSAGLQVVLKCAKKAKEKGFDIYLQGAKGTVREIFQISGFYTFIKEME
jgi:anti-anti-sigma factor